MHFFDICKVVVNMSLLPTHHSAASDALALEAARSAETDNVNTVHR